MDPMTDQPITSPAQDAHLKALSETIKESPVHCTGVFPAPAAGLPLYYTDSTNEVHRRLDLTNASESDLAQLAAACQAASFGLGQQNVLDESYRKAGKLDAGSFAINLDIVNMGLLDSIRAELVQLDDEYKNLVKPQGIHSELYKLNVYEKGSFFKAHKDTPRSEKMFGSLVLVFPTAHDGGALILRHGGKEHIIDTGKILAASNQPNGPGICFIAFFSDVFHEVSVVNSGYRVTLTYNLYFTNDVHRTRPTAQLDDGSDSGFKQAFKMALRDPAFLPDGGKLGFTLRHQYPTFLRGRRGPYRDFSGHPHGRFTAPGLTPARLIGTDATLFTVFRDLALETSIPLICDPPKEYDDWVLIFDEVPEAPETPLEGGLYYFEQEQGARRGYIINGGQRVPRKYCELRDLEIWWVGDFTLAPERGDDVEINYIAYGNEPTLAYMYGNFAFLIDVPPFQQRGMAN